MTTAIILCILWVVSMGTILNIALQPANYTFPQWRKRMRTCFAMCLIITLLYAWVIVRLSSSQEHPHEELILPPASDELIGSTCFLNQTIVDV
jgi:hypothetical protein